MKSNKAQFLLLSALLAAILGGILANARDALGAVLDLFGL